MTPARGLTLVEVMIAVAITAVLGVLSLGAFQRAQAAKTVTTEEDDRYATARVALTRLSRELSEAFLSDHYDRKRFRERPTLFVGRDRGEEDTLLFTTMTHERLTRDVKESDQALVAYTLEQDPAHPGERALFRREKPILDEDPERGGTSAVVCEHVAGFDVQYFDWKKGEWVRDWVTTGAEHPNLLPSRVKVRLTLAFPGGRRQVFETQARVALQKPLAF